MNLLLIMRIVLLVDDDRVLDIVHNDVMEDELRSRTGRRTWPRLDSHSILSASQRAVLHRDPSHVCLIWVLPKAPDTVMNE